MNPQQMYEACTDANAFKRALEPPYPDAPFYGAPASR